MNRLLPHMLVIVAVGSVGCSSSDFSGSSAKRGKAEEEDKPKVKKKPPSDTDTDSDTEKNDDGADIVIGDSNKCTAATRGKIRIALMVDGSNTVHSAMPEIRASAAALLAEIKAKSAKENSPQFFFTSIKIASDEGDGPVYQAPGGWVEVSGESVGAADESVAWVTQESYDDRYDPAFALAYEQFKANGASVSKKNERNYIAAIGDHQHTDDATFPAISNQLADELGVAIFHYQIKDSPDPFYSQSLAMPTSGRVAPDHVGQAFSAANGQGISHIFGHIGGKFKDLVFCE